MGHGKLRGHTIGSRLIVEALLIAFLVATYLAASFLNFGPSTTIAVVALLVPVLATIAVLDFFCAEISLLDVWPNIHPPRACHAPFVMKTPNHSLNRTGGAGVLSARSRSA
jgi:hypothetical protein